MPPLVCLLALMPFAWAALPLATQEEPSTGRISGVSGLRYGTGGLADELTSGCSVGLEAAYQPMGPDQRVGWGGTWALSMSWYGADSARVADQLAIVEMDAGLRLRVPLGERRRVVLFGAAGGSFVRVNEPVTRDGDRDQIGPWGGAGVEFMMFGRMVGVQMRYGNVVSGSGTIGLQVLLGRGV